MAFNRFKLTSKKPKYGNVKATRMWNGKLVSFSSRLEAAVFDIIMNRETRGELTLLKCQDYQRLGPPEIIYIPDFKAVRPDGVEFWIEAKGKIGPRWPTQQKAWAAYGPGELEIWKGSYTKPILEKIIVPEITYITCPKCKCEFIQE